MPAVTKPFWARVFSRWPVAAIGVGLLVLWLAAIVSTETQRPTETRVWFVARLSMWQDWITVPVYLLAMALLALWFAARRRIK